MSLLSCRVLDFAYTCGHLECALWE